MRSNFRSINWTIFFSCLPTCSHGLLTVFCYALVCVSCNSNSPLILICWVWFDMYWRHSYVEKLLHVWTPHPLQRWTPEETHAELQTSAEKATSVCESSLMRQLLSCVAHLHLWWLLLKWKIEQCTLWCHGKGKSIEPMRSCSHTCKCIWALNVTDYQ